MEYYSDKVSKIREEVGQVIIGKNDIVNKILAAIFAKGHILLEDIPGVGKTTLALAFSKAMSMEYKRMQFTPDVLPSDVTGFSLYNKKINEFEYKEGAVLCNLFLADEINRTSPKTQSALLEAMEEGKVTVDGITHVIPEPFAVIATQNPLGSIGTQKLPESQLDRFMIRLSMGYPDLQSEMNILMGEQNKNLDKVTAVITKEEILFAQSEVEKVYVAPVICEYMAKLIQATRENELIKLGLSPRGGIALLRLSKAIAYLNQRDYMIPEDILASFYDVGIHRVVLSSKAKAGGMTEIMALDEVKKAVPLPLKR